MSNLISLPGFSDFIAVLSLISLTAADSERRSNTMMVCVQMEILRSQDLESCSFFFPFPYPVLIPLISLFVHFCY